MHCLVVFQIRQKLILLSLVGILLGIKVLESSATAPLVEEIRSKLTTEHGWEGHNVFSADNSSVELKNRTALKSWLKEFNELSSFIEEEKKVSPLAAQLAECTLPDKTPSSHDFFIGHSQGGDGAPLSLEKVRAHIAKQLYSPERYKEIKEKILSLPAEKRLSGQRYFYKILRYYDLYYKIISFTAPEDLEQESDLTHNTLKEIRDEIERKANKTESTLGSFAKQWRAKRQAQQTALQEGRARRDLLSEFAESEKGKQLLRIDDSEESKQDSHRIIAWIKGLPDYAFLYGQLFAHDWSQSYHTDTFRTIIVEKRYFRSNKTLHLSDQECITTILSYFVEKYVELYFEEKERILKKSKGNTLKYRSKKDFYNFRNNVAHRFSLLIHPFLQLFSNVHARLEFFQISNKLFSYPDAARADNEMLNEFHIYSIMAGVLYRGIKNVPYGSLSETVIRSLLKEELLAQRDTERIELTFLEKSDKKNPSALVKRLSSQARLLLLSVDLYSLEYPPAFPSALRERGVGATAISELYKKFREKVGIYHLHQSSKDEDFMRETLSFQTINDEIDALFLQLYQPVVQHMPASTTSLFSSLIERLIVWEEKKDITLSKLESFDISSFLSEEKAFGYYQSLMALFLLVLKKRIEHYEHHMQALIVAQQEDHKEVVGKALVNHTYTSPVESEAKKMLASAQTNIELLKTDIGKGISDLSTTTTDLVKDFSNRFGHITSAAEDIIEKGEIDNAADQVIGLLNKLSGLTPLTVNIVDRVGQTAQKMSQVAVQDLRSMADLLEKQQEKMKKVLAASKKTLQVVEEHVSAQLAGASKLVSTLKNSLAIKAGAKLVSGGVKLTRWGYKKSAQKDSPSGAQTLNDKLQAPLEELRQALAGEEDMHGKQVREGK